MLLFLMILRILRAMCCDTFRCLKQYSNWLEAKILWNSVFRFIIQQYPPIAISALINIYEFDTSSAWKTISTYTAVAVFGLCLIAIISMSVIIYKNRFNLDSQEFQDKYGTLVERLDLCKYSQKALSQHYNVLTLWRWTLASVVFVVVRSNGPF